MSQIRESFITLYQYLRSHDRFWRESPFCQNQLSWQREYPALSAKLIALSDAEYNQLAASQSEVDLLVSEFVPDVSCDLTIPSASKSAAQVTTLGCRSLNGISGRKINQIEYFAQAIQLDHGHSSQIVDWCCGKAHLGRLLANSANLSLKGYEKTRKLCDDAKALADTHNVKHNIIQCDVIAENCEFESSDTVVALHACGDLHRALIKTWSASASPSLFMSPCCYHLWLKQDYQPLSITGAKHNLNLSKNCVQLALLSTHHATQREQEQRDTLKTWRLAFGYLQKELRKTDEYLPTPSYSTGKLKHGFHAFLSAMFKHHKINMPTGIDEEQYLQLGQQQFARVKRLQLVRQSFQRAIELWLAYDIALYLEEHGANVSVTRFCDPSVTPRNIFISAQKQAQKTRAAQQARV